MKKSTSIFPSIRAMSMASQLMILSSASVHAPKSRPFLFQSQDAQAAILGVEILQFAPFAEERLVDILAAQPLQELGHHLPGVALQTARDLAAVNPGRVERGFSRIG